MSFEVYPGGPAGPLPIPAGTTGTPIAITEHAAVDAATARTLMFLRVVQVDEGAGPASPPTIRLAIDGGQAIAVESTPTALRAQPGVGAPLAIATRRSEADDIHVVEVELVRSGHAWSLRIDNADGRDHRYTWVVASTDPQTRQPWLNVPTPALGFPTAAGAAAADLELANYGPGALVLTDPDGADLGMGFRLTGLDAHTVGGNQRATARIAFTPAPPATARTVHAFVSNDPAAGLTPGHRNQVTLTADFPAWRPGAVLAVTAGGLCTLDRFTGALTPVAPSLAGAVAVAVDPTTGDALVLGSDVVRVARLTGEPTRPAGMPGLGAPVGVVVNAQGSVFVLDSGPARLIRLDPGSEVAEVVQVRGLDAAHGVALEADGNLVVACGGATAAGKVLRIFADSGETSMISSDSALTGPVGGLFAVAVEHDGTILAIRRTQGGGGGFTFSAGTMFRVDPHTHVVTRLLEHNTLFEPNALAVAADSAILVGGGGGVFAIDPRTTAETQLTSTRATGVAVVPTLGG